MFKKIKQILCRGIENKEISYKKLQDMIKKDPSAILIDVRSKQEYEEGHLEGSINIPVYDIENSAKIKLKDKTKTIILYCASGHRSKSAKEILEKLGYENVYHLKNGLNDIEM